MRAKILPFIIILFLMPIFVYAQNYDNSLINELIIKSGMEKEIKQILFMIQAGFDQSVQEDKNLQKMPKETNLLIKDLAQKAFAPENLEEVIRMELRENLTGQDIKEVLIWLDSPLGKKCTQLEESADTPEAYAAKQQYAVQIKKSPPKAERLNSLKNFDSAIKLTESSVEMTINTQIAITMAIIATFPVERQRSIDDITREVEKNRSATTAAVKSEILVALLYTYRSLTEAEIQQYIAFARSPAGSKYHSISMAAFRKAIYGGSVRWGKSIGEALQKRKSQSNA